MPILYVLWIVALLSLITAASLFSATTASHLARNALHNAQTEALAEAAVNRAVLGLLEPRALKRWRVDGKPQEFMFDGRKMHVSIQDETGRIDLNHADGELLRSLFQSAGANAQFAAQLVDRVLDWRDARPFRRLNGAKDAEYRAAGLAYRPRSGPFQNVDELKQVLGMPQALFSQIRPALTVYSGRQFIDPQFAPRQALLALPGQNNHQASQSNGSQSSGILDPAFPLGGRAFAIRIEMDIDGTKLRREAIVRLTDDLRSPYWMLNWSRQ